MARGEFQPPTLTYVGVTGGEEFIGGVVPALTPETYDPELAIEEVERAQADESLLIAAVEIDVLNNIFELESGGY